MIQFHQYLLIAVLFGVFSCSKKEAENNVDGREPRPLGNKPLQGSVANSPLPASAKPQISASANDKLPEVLTNKFHQLRGNSPKIPIYLDISSGMWGPPLRERTLNTEPLAVLNSNKEAGTLVKTLRSGEAIEGVDLKTSVGYMSLITGWLLDDENKQNIYLIFSQRSQDPVVSKGDVMLSIVASEAIQMSSSGGILSIEQSTEWFKLAKGQNPVIRQIAALLLPRLTWNFDDQYNFLLAYGEEVEPAIIETVVDSIRRMPKSKGDELILKLSDLQRRSGNILGADYLIAQLNTK